MYSITSRVQPKRGDPPSWELGEVLKTLRRKNWPRYEMELETGGISVNEPPGSK
jgi:hypothetical protein